MDNSFRTSSGLLGAFTPFKANTKWSVCKDGHLATGFTMEFHNRTMIIWCLKNPDPLTPLNRKNRKSIWFLFFSPTCSSSVTRIFQTNQHSNQSFIVALYFSHLFLSKLSHTSFIFKLPPTYLFQIKSTLIST